MISYIYIALHFMTQDFDFDVAGDFRFNFVDVFWDPVMIC